MKSASPRKRGRSPSPSYSRSHSSHSPAHKRPQSDQPQSHVSAPASVAASVAAPVAAPAPAPGPVTEPAPAKAQVPAPAPAPAPAPPCAFTLDGCPGIVGHSLGFWNLAARDGPKWSQTGSSPLPCTLTLPRQLRSYLQQRQRQEPDIQLDALLGECVSVTALQHSGELPMRFVLTAPPDKGVRMPIVLEWFVDRNVDLTDAATLRVYINRKSLPLSSNHGEHFMRIVAVMTYPDTIGEVVKRRVDVCFSAAFQVCAKQPKPRADELPGARAAAAAAAADTRIDVRDLHAMKLKVEDAQYFHSVYVQRTGLDDKMKITPLREGGWARFIQRAPVSAPAPAPAPVPLAVSTQKPAPAPVALAVSAAVLAPAPVSVQAPAHVALAVSAPAPVALLETARAQAPLPTFVSAPTPCPGGS